MAAITASVSYTHLDVYKRQVIDTSDSTSGELVRAVLAETYTLLKGQENFFHRMNLHLIQADNAIRQDILIHNCLLYTSRCV